MRLIALLLMGIALPNVYMKYLLLEIDGDETPEVVPKPLYLPNLEKDDDIVGDETPEVEPKSDKEAENEAAPHLGEPLFVGDLEKDDDSTGDIKTDNDNVDEDTGDYKYDPEYPNEVSETSQKQPKTVKQSLKPKSKPSKTNKKNAKKNKKNAGLRSLGGSSLKSHPKRKLVNAKKCGYTRGFSSKIVGGEDAFLTDFPWLVMVGPVGDDGRVLQYSCGGSLITMSVVLTASHCLYPSPEQENSDVQFKKLRVKIGAETRSQQDGFEEIDVIKKIAHEKYEPIPYKNDIALLKLKHAYDNKGKEFKANTICLPFDEKPNEKYLGDPVTVAGWGWTVNRGELADRLQKLVTKVMPYAKCKQAHADSGTPVLEANNVCAGGDKGKDSCGGDSGGPLMIERKKANKPRKSWTQVGLVSWGIDCGTEGVPGVYTNVQHYLKWILDHL